MDNENEEMVTISKARYKGLLDAESKLEALEAGGVDNWEWYDDSLEEYWNQKRRELNE